MIQEEEKQLAQLELIDLPLRKRGSHAKRFRKSVVVSNHYYIELREQLDKIVIFSIKYSPLIAFDNSKLRYQVLSNLIPQIKHNIKNPIISGNNIYSLHAPLNPEMDYQEGDYRVTVKQVKVYDISKNPKMMLTFLNNALRGVMRKLNFVQIGKTGKYFNAKDRTEIDNLFMYNGYKSNFVMLQKGYFLRVDSAKKIVRNQTVLQFIDDVYKIHKNKEKDERRSILKNQIINKIVMSNYGKTRYHRILDVEFQDLDSVLITNKTCSMNLREYYQQKYQISIKNLKQPLLVTEGFNKEEKCLLVPELLLMTGIPEDFDEMRRKKISEHTIKFPNEKMKEISGLMDRLNKVDDFKWMQNIGIKLKRQMERVNSKTIDAPILQLGKKSSVQRGKESFFNLFNKPIFASKHKIIMAVIYFSSSDVRPMMDTISRTSANLGVELQSNTYQLKEKPSVGAINSEIKKAVERGNNIVLIVLPAFLKNNYKDVKVFAIREQEIISQVITEYTLRKKNIQSIATKVLLQIIAKRGNILWVPQLTCQLHGTTLVGFDTTKMGGQSLMGICATINSTFSSIFSKVQVYNAAQNKFQAMVELLLASVTAYLGRNKSLPKEAVIFMNSSPGDQVPLYHEFFVNEFNKRIRQTYEDQSILLSVVMINVKTSERFFSDDHGQIKNVQAGTLVAEELVSPNYDFYIVSQQSTRGTTVPNHYRVIYSNSNIEDGELQELAFSQCFNYVNWTGSIKVPAILQYAKKCVKFSSEIMQKNEVPNTLQTKLYFV